MSFEYVIRYRHVVKVCPRLLASRQMDVLGCEYAAESRSNRDRTREVYIRGAMSLTRDRPSANRQT